MNPDGGYTRQYRRMWDNPVFRSYQEAAVFSWMKDVAQWRETTIRTKFGPVKLGVGELLMAERPTADAFGLHRNTLRSLIHRMVDEGLVAIANSNLPKEIGVVIWVDGDRDFDAIPFVRLPEPRRATLSKRVRQAVSEKTNGSCFYCNKPLSKSPGPDQFHVDHRIPLSRGGTNAMENLVPSCAACNLSKSDKRPGEWAQRKPAEAF